MAFYLKEERFCADGRAGGNSADDFYPFDAEGEDAHYLGEVEAGRRVAVDVEAPAGEGAGCGEVEGGGGPGSGAG